MAHRSDSQRCLESVRVKTFIAGRDYDRGSSLRTSRTICRICVSAFVPGPHLTEAVPMLYLVSTSPTSFCLSMRDGIGVGTTRDVTLLGKCGICGRRRSLERWTCWDVALT